MAETTKADKRKKMHPDVVDISNGALFLRIEALEREVRWLKRELQNVESRTDFQVGPGSGYNP